MGPPIYCPSQTAVGESKLSGTISDKQGDIEAAAGESNLT